MFESVDRMSGESVSVADVARRLQLVRGAGRLAIQEQLDWGEALLASGDKANARVILQAAFIQQGFSPQLERARRHILMALIDRRAVLPFAAINREHGKTTEIAIAELRSFAAGAGEAMATGLSNQRRNAKITPGLHPTAILASKASLPSEQSIAYLVDKAFVAVRSTEYHDDENGLASTIDALRGAKDAPVLWTADLAGAPVAILISAVAMQELGYFFRASVDLLQGPLGSPALFRAAAAFDSAGLGPYFGNVGQIVRRSANLFELAGIADAAGGGIGEDAWIVLLSRGLSGGLLMETIDDLGDRSASFALRAILERIVAVPDFDLSLVQRIRDAALDNLDYDLAGFAQQAVVSSKPHDMGETRLLGSIAASAGRVAAAERHLLACLHEAPEDQHLKDLIEANRARRYGAFALLKGLDSPRDRQLKRLQRRASSLPVICSPERPPSSAVGATQ